MSKAIKQLQMDILKSSFKDVRDLVMLNIVGLNAIDDNKMRLGLRKKGIRLHQVKNSLCKRVFDELGLQIAKAWEGNTTVAWGAGSVAELCKELQTLVKKHDKFIKVKTAVAEGQEVSFDIAIKMPTRTEAIGRVVQLTLSPASWLVGQILGPAASVASQIKSLKDKKEEPSPAA